MHRVLISAERFGASGEEKNKFLLFAGGVEEGSGLRVANALVLFMMNVRGGILIWEFALLQ